MTTPNTPDTTNEDAELMPMESVDRDVLKELQSYAEAWGAAASISEQLARTDFAGPFKGKPADMAAAILKGATIGIPPADIGKAIYVVHGTPALYGKTALAIALRHGYRADTLEDTPEAVTVRMTSPQGQEMDVRYTIERAEKEGLVKGNAAQYKSRPSKMLYWKCIGELTDRMIPHLTGGMPIKEDVQQSAPVRATATRTDVPAAGGGALSAIEAARSRVQARRAATEEPVDTAHDQEPAVDVQAVIDGNAMLRELLDALVDCDSEQAMHSEVGSRVSELGGDAAALGVLRAAWTERAAELAAEVAS